MHISSKNSRPCKPMKFALNLLEYVKLACKNKKVANYLTKVVHNIHTPEAQQRLIQIRGSNK